MNDLDRHPDFLADLIPVPPVPVGDDVARGERALRRRRLFAGAGSAVAVVVIAGGLAWAGGGHAPRATPPTYAAPSHSATPSPRAIATILPKMIHKKRPPDPLAGYEKQMNASKKTVGEWRDVLAEHLSAYGTLQEYDGVGFSGSLADYGTKLDWNDGGLLQFMIGPHWNAIQGVPGAPVPPLKPRTYQGMEAQVGEANGVLVVSLRHEDGTVVTLLAATSFGNNGSTTASLGLTADNLLEAAADPRLSNPPGQ